MSKQMIVNASAAEEIRVAIVENNRLTDLDFESQSRTKHKGNIYKGIVANVEDSLEAAFIEFGDDKQGFLPLSEVRPALYPEEVRGQRRPKISDVLKRGQEIIVQITKDEIGQKGAAVTTYLSLPGRYVVLMHSDDGGGGISRKIDDENARRRAREMLSRIAVPEGLAVIIRTAGMNRPLADLYRDLKSLCQTWERIDRGAQLGRAPTQLYREPDLVVRTIRDYLSPEMEKIVIDSEDEYQEILAYFEDRMPDLVHLLERFEGRQPVFEACGIEKAIEDLFHREVKLPSGGYLVIDQTEALVAVDVNSGKSTKEEDHEATVYKTNLEAAAELARQLRLRDLGGIIVVDFIDMVSRKHERDVERAVKDAMRADRAKVKIGRISENGTLELTRQRLRQAHRLISFTKCEHCDGTGLVRDPEGLAVAALRLTHSRLAKGAERLAKLSVRLPVAVANVLNNNKRRRLVELSEMHQITVDVIADERLSGSDLRFEEERRGRAGLEAAHGFKDPRLADEGRGRGRNRGRGRGRSRPEEAAPLPAASTPPPSIGEVPTFLQDEDALMRADVELPPAQEETRTSAVQHFDDPLTEALFGDAPELQLADVEAEAPVQPREDGPRKKRRRRRRRGRGGERGEEESAERAEANGAMAADDDETTNENDGTEETSVDEETLAANAEATAADTAATDEEQTAELGADPGVAPKDAESRRGRSRGSRSRNGRGARGKGKSETAPGGDLEAVAEAPQGDSSASDHAAPDDAEATTAPASEATTSVAKRPRARKPRARSAAATAKSEITQEDGVNGQGAREAAPPVESTAAAVDDDEAATVVKKKRARRAPRARSALPSDDTPSETAPLPEKPSASSPAIEG